MNKKYAIVFPGNNTQILLCSALKFQTHENAEVSSIVNFPMHHQFSHFKILHLYEIIGITSMWYFYHTESIIQTTNTGSLTLVAFFMNLALSFSMSCQDLIGVFSSSPTTMPGP